MNKKIFAVLIVLIAGLAGLQNLGKAQELPIQTSGNPSVNAAMIVEKFQESSATAPVFGSPIRKPVVDVIKGIAFDKTTMKEEAVVLLRLESSGEDTIYLLKGSEILKLKVEETEGSGNFWFIRLSAGSEDIDLIVQQNGAYYISGTFRNYLLSFEPYYVPYYGCYDRYCATGIAEGQAVPTESPSPFWEE